MSIGLRSFLVIADSLQRKEADPPMPQTMGVMPSGNTLRFKKTFINKYLSDDTAKLIGMAAYYPHVRKAFDSILRLLDSQVGKPMLMTKTENINREPEEIITLVLLRFTFIVCLGCLLQLFDFAFWLHHFINAVYGNF